MDSADARIIAELRRNSRISLSDLATVVGLSRVTVRTRLTRLEATGIIVGYTVLLSEDIRQSPVRALMMLAIEGRGTDRILGQLRGLTTVQAIHTTNGRFDLIIELATETLDALDTVITKIRNLEGVKTSETNLLLATRMTTRP